MRGKQLFKGLRALFGALCLLFSATLASEIYPQRPIRLIVTFPPGGGTDLLARKVAEQLAEYLPQPIIVENKPGASGNIGARHVAQAHPDGHTLLMVNSTYAINPGIYPDLGFDPAQDLIPIANIAWVPSVWITGAQSHLQSIADVMSYEQQHHLPLQYGSCGPGTPQHLAAEMFSQETGVVLQHVPYNGCGPALNDVLAGHVLSALVTLSSASPYLQRGDVRALALTSTERSQVFTDIPTIREEIDAPYDVNQWHALFAPAHTSAATIEYLRTQLERVLASPKMQADLQALGYELSHEGAEQFEHIVQKDLARYAKLLQKQD